MLTGCTETWPQSSASTTPTSTWGRCSWRRPLRGLCLSQLRWRTAARWTGKHPTPHLPLDITVTSWMNKSTGHNLVWDHGCMYTDRYISTLYMIKSILCNMGPLEEKLTEQCVLQVHSLPPSSEHPGTGREPHGQVQLQLRGDSYSSMF